MRSLHDVLGGLVNGGRHRVFCGQRRHGGWCGRRSGTRRVWVGAGSGGQCRREACAAAWRVAGARAALQSVCEVATRLSWRRTHLLASPGAGPGQGCEAAVGLSCRPCQNTCTGPGGAVVKRRMRNGTPGRGYLDLQVMTAQHGWAPSARVTEGGSLISLQCMYTLSKHCEHGPAGFAAADTPAAERHLPVGPGPRLTPGFQAKYDTCGPIGDAADPALHHAGCGAPPCAVPPVRRGLSRCLPDLPSLPPAATACTRQPGDHVGAAAASWEQLQFAAPAQRC